jgi:hypothetical protein
VATPVLTHHKKTIFGRKEGRKEGPQIEAAVALLLLLLFRRELKKGLGTGETPFLAASLHAAAALHNDAVDEHETSPIAKTATAAQISELTDDVNEL